MVDSTPAPLDNQIRPYRTGSGAYWSKRFPTDRRVYISPPPRSKWATGHGGYSTDTLTPLDEVVAPALTDLPGSVQGLLRTEFWSRLDGCADWSAKFEAQAWLAGATTDFNDAHLDIAYDFEEIEQRARRCAEICEHISTYEGVHEYTNRKGLNLPPLRGAVTARGCIDRARNHKWWRRGLSKLYRRRAEKKLRDAGFIHRRRSVYASTFALSARRQQAQATCEYLKQRVAVSAAGIQLNLWDVHQRSLANPAIRRAELMTRLKGFENVAQELGHVAEFITATCPSEFHAYNAVDGNKNPHYKGHSVRDGHGWLNRIWQKARAKLARQGILIYGFRVAEPHHDGTPHWHMVLFTPPAHLAALRTVLREYWLSECGGETGARVHRIKFKSIDPAKGSACGYLAKYIAKNIDGFEVGTDLEADPQQAIDDRRQSDGQSREIEMDVTGSGHWPPSPQKGATDASATVQRVGAWAALHGIRQFQQIGGPQVTIYRELRRLRSSVDKQRGRSDSSVDARPLVDVAPIERARVCADAGDWGGFIGSIGGIAAGRKGSLSLWKETTGECNGYSELKGPQIVGVGCAGVGARTRVESWTIVQLKTPARGRMVASAFPELAPDAGVTIFNPDGSRSLLTGTSVSNIAVLDASKPCTPKNLFVATKLLIRSSLLPSLGPVTITVRGAPALSEPRGWTNPQESSMYGPN